MAVTARLTQTYCSRQQTADAVMKAGTEVIKAAGFAVDYFEVRHAETLTPIASRKGSPDADAGRRQDRNHAADRQYRGLGCRPRPRLRWATSA